MIKYIAILLIILIPSQLLAETCPRTKIEKGTPAPCSGFILSQEVMDETVKLPQEISLLNEKLKIKEDQLSFKEEKITLYLNMVDKKDVTISGLQQAIIAKDNNESLKLGLAIGLSVVATAAISIALAFAFSGAIKFELK